MTIERAKKLLQSCIDGDRRYNLTIQNIDGDISHNFTEEFRRKLENELSTVRGVNKRKGKFLYIGSGGIAFYKNQLVTYLAQMVAAGKVQEATKALSNFSKDEWLGYVIVTITGIKVEEELMFGNGLRLVPFKHLPDSMPKKMTKLGAGFMGRTSYPDSAIVSKNFELSIADPKGVGRKVIHNKEIEIFTIVDLIPLVTKAAALPVSWWWQPGEGYPNLSSGFSSSTEVQNRNALPPMKFGHKEVDLEILCQFFRLKHNYMRRIDDEREI